MKETWHPIPDYPYELSNKGRVRRSQGGVHGARVGHILKPRPHRAGYTIYLLNKNHKPWYATLNYLIALVFIGPRPSPKHVAAHWDGNASNNKIKNIRWATEEENAADKDRHGRTPRGNKHGLARLSDNKVRTLRRLRVKGWTYKRLAKRYKVTASQVYNADKRITWGHVT